MFPPIDTLCHRPGFGKAGRLGQVQTNYFPINCDRLGTIYQYNVSISPEVPSSVNKQIFSQLEAQYRNDNQVLGGIFTVYDGASIVFAPRRLPFGQKFCAEIVLPERGRAKKEGSGRIFNVNLMVVNEIVADLSDMYQRNNNGLMALSAFNTSFQHLPNNSFIQIKNSFFTREGSHMMRGGIEVWPGFFRSVLAVADGLALNVDPTVCVFYQPGSLLDLVAEYIGLRSREELRDPRLKHHVKRIQVFLKNVRIVLEHRGVVSREHKIIKLTEGSAESTTFLLIENGDEVGKISVAQYFFQKHGIQLSFPTLPCIEIKKGVVIPMELCRVLEGQRYTRKLSEAQTADMIKITCTNPKARLEKILSGIRVMDYANSEGLVQFGLRLVPVLKTVASRLLPSPSVLYHPDSRQKIVRPIDGAWSLKDVRMFDAKELHIWGVVVFAPENVVRRATVENFLRVQISTAQDKGLIMAPKPDIFYASTTNVERALYDIYISVGNKHGKKPQLLMCIVNERSNALYGGIKSTCELKLGIPTQCLMANKIVQPKSQYCANVVLKLNAKLGGINAAVKPEELGQLKTPSTIIIGADVSHPAPGFNGGSVAAAVASTDYTACRYASSTRIQVNRTELIQDLQAMVVELLKSFYRSVLDKPEHIIYFRDGVSDGQFSQVLLHEMAAIKRACAALETGYSPKVTFIVVQKRHHTRFFPIKSEDADRSGNCKAGTVVETGICHRFYFDFFLQSHGGLQGTSRPVHYHVLVDEIRFTPDSLQKLCNSMSYLFNRATRAVSLVPPVYYAHLAADRARFHFQVIEGTESQSSSSSPDIQSIHHDMISCMYYV